MLHFTSIAKPVIRRVATGGLLLAITLVIHYGCTNKKNDDQTAAGSAVNAKQTASVAEENMNTLTTQEKNDGWVLLFDGQNTDAWRGYNQEKFPIGGWVVKDSLLMMEATGKDKEEEGYGGDIVTKDQYENFEFKMDFKLSQGANGGILYLVKEEKNVPIWHNAPEYQLLDNESFASKRKYIMDKHRTGDCFDVMAATEDAMKPMGLWNQAMVRINNRKVEHWLNGKKVLEYKLGSPEWKALVQKSKFAKYPGFSMAKKGNIAIQDWGHQMWYRNIKIRPIPATGNATASR